MPAMVRNVMADSPYLFTDEFLCMAIIQGYLKSFMTDSTKDEWTEWTLHLVKLIKIAPVHQSGDVDARYLAICQVAHWQWYREREAQPTLFGPSFLSSMVSNMAGDSCHSSEWKVWTRKFKKHIKTHPQIVETAITGPA